MNGSALLSRTDERGRVSAPSTPSRGADATPLVAEVKAKLAEWHADDGAHDCPLPELFRRLERIRRSKPLSAGPFPSAEEMQREDRAR